MREGCHLYKLTENDCGKRRVEISFTNRMIMKSMGPRIELVNFRNDTSLTKRVFKSNLLRMMSEITPKSVN